MDYIALLKSEAEQAYRAADGLMNMVDEDGLDWKPATGDNWMTMAQLLEHITGACGVLCKGFVTGDWTLRDGTDLTQVPPEEMMAPAEAQPAAGSLAAAKQALAADKEVALEMIAQAEGRLEEPVQAPWDQQPIPLGQQLLSMINHLNGHKAQLFYYLKLQGKPVSTLHYYGMA